MTVMLHPTYRDGSGRPLVLYVNLEETCPVCGRGTLWVQHHDHPNYQAHCNRCDHVEYRETGDMRLWARIYAAREEAARVVG